MDGSRALHNPEAIGRSSGWDNNTGEQKAPSASHVVTEHKPATAKTQEQITPQLITQTSFKMMQNCYDRGSEAAQKPSPRLENTGYFSES